jgi:hypothetical protein
MAVAFASKVLVDKLKQVYVILGPDKKPHVFEELPEKIEIKDNQNNIIPENQLEVFPGFKKIK